MNGGQVALAYNGLGQLVAKTAGGVTTQYLTDDLSPTGYPQVVAELVNGQPVRTYTYGLERISELQTVNNAPTASFYQYDGRGTVRMLTSAAGAVTDTYEYDAFGNLISRTGPTPNAYLYRGERYDTDLGLYYLRARWYNPVTGRFMTRDPYQGSIYDPASLHRYNYARANPANFVDPSGRDAVEYVQLTAANSLRTGFLNTLAGNIRCQYWSLASTVGIIGQHIGEHIDGLGTLWSGCKAHLTVSGYYHDLLLNSAIAFGFDLASGYLLGEFLGGEELAADAPRGATKSGGFISSTTNSAGGTVTTASGRVVGSDLEPYIRSAANSASYSGEDVNVLSGVHGTPNGTTVPDADFYNEDINRYNDLQNVNVYDYNSLSPEQITNMVNGPGTTVGAFCDSGACLLPMVK